MERLVDKAAMRRWSQRTHAAGRRIALVPTMGGLHAGHLALVALARDHADAVVVSVYVNPTQFDRAADLAAYPRDLAADAAALEAAGVDALFAPADMYDGVAQPSTWVTVEGLTDRLCGATRPGHFRGVTTVVTKFFNVVAPDVAVFGRKDLQQLKVIERMVRELDQGVAIIGAPLVRDADGLALSSRNTRLTPTARQAALALPTALAWARDAVAAGATDPAPIIAEVRRRLVAAGGEVDYVAIVDDEELAPLARIEGPAHVAAAVFFGGVRLIDNVATL